MQQFLKSARGAAWAKIIAPEFFRELFIAVNNSVATFYPRFGRESLATFAGDFEVGDFIVIAVCHTDLRVNGE